MQYSPKLKMAMEEIKAITKKYDIAASVVLHTNGFSEYLNAVEPSYSCIKIENGGIRIRSKARSKEDLTATVNMVSLFAETMGNMAMTYFDMKEMLQKHMDIDEGPASHSGHETQNN